MKKLDIGVIVTTLIIVTISCSLAFFAARVVGEPKDINLVAKNVAITFNDTSIIANGVVSPGWNTTKTFTITNNSKEEYKYNISIKDLINTFVTEGYLQYKITSTNDGYNMTEFKDIPKSSIATDTILAYSVVIPNGVTQNYTIEFKYANDESVDQSDDMGKKLSGTLFITEGTEDPSLATLIKANAVNENGYRYEGTDPNNYIYMTNKSTNEKELWRIIGLFPDGVNGENVIRVRRHYEKNNYPTMAYDEERLAYIETSETNKNLLAYNDIFNKNYIAAPDPNYCPGCGNHFPNTKMYNTLSSTYKLTNYSHTVNFKMHLGTSDTSLTSSGWFTAERGNVPGYTAANNYNNSVSFIGSVGLIYPSDYGYGVLASDCPRTKKLYNYQDTAACYDNNWLFQGGSQVQWLISPSASYADNAFLISSNGFVGYNHYGNDFVKLALASSPVMSLESGVMVNGSGTKSDPYNIIN